MNKIATLIAAFGISMGASAQSYDKLWQEAKAHVDNDLPKSAIEVVNKIQQKAVAEGNDAQLLRVMLTQRMLGAELSVDSVAPWLQRMEAALAANDGKEYDLSICCVNIESCEMSAILPVRDDGLVYFFSMATSFTKAALGAEGIGKDVTMIIGNGYTKNHAQITLDVLRENPKLRKLFDEKYC